MQNFSKNIKPTSYMKWWYDIQDDVKRSAKYWNKNWPVSNLDDSTAYEKAKKNLS